MKKTKGAGKKKNKKRNVSFFIKGTTCNTFGFWNFVDCFNPMVTYAIK